MKSKHVYFVQFGVMLALAALSACTTGVKPDAKPGAKSAVKADDSAIIQTRAVERWDLLIAHNADKAYDYLSPGYRETKTRDAYAREMNGRGVRWSKITFGSQECDGDICKVHLSVDYNVNLPGAAGKTNALGLVTETWIKANGGWYFLPEQFQPTKLGKKPEQ